MIDQTQPKRKSEPESLGVLFTKYQKVAKPKAPAYQWQDFALSIIKDLRVPNFKRASVFKICKDLPKETVQRAVNDTKELCSNGEAWKYFFKVIANKDDNSGPKPWVQKQWTPKKY